MTLYKNKYRVESARLKGWDYSSDGYYFITICTKARVCLFGDVIAGKMVLNDCGDIVEREWNKSFQIRSELFCDYFVIMPNHIHGIVIVAKNDGGDALPCVCTMDMDTGTGIAERMPRSISSFVAGFKASATKQINEIRNSPGIPVWQSRFHDHIVRNEDELNRIQKYIIENPLKWELDKLYVSGGSILR